MVIHDNGAGEKLLGGGEVFENFFQAYVRQYGADVAERFRSAGFNPESFLPNSYMSQQDIYRCGIRALAQKPLFYCQKNET